MVLGELERLALDAVPSGSVDEIQKEARVGFALAERLAEKGYSYIQGGREYRKFNAELTDESVALEAICSLTRRREYDTNVLSARFRVVDLSDGGEMVLRFWREKAKKLSLDDDFSQMVLGYFQAHLEEHSWGS
ncbi:MAG: hypothetical protein U5K77_00690 [Candidatus Saccharibacteria bacterium]|nr:hypothetical protein [Candidatus Saccharibacteria bacterium]